MRHLLVVPLDALHLRLLVVAESGQEVAGQVQLGHPGAGPVLGGRQVLDEVVGQIQNGEAVELCQVARHLGELVVGQVQPLQ